MTKEEALKLLEDAPADDKPSRVNKGITRAQGRKIMIDGISSMKEGQILNDLFVKRVHQICQDRVRPNIWLR